MRTSGSSASLFSSVLCPVDFSEHSRAALRFAAAVSRRASAPLRVMFVNDPLLIAAAAAAYSRSTLGAATETELKRFVASTLRPRELGSVALRYSTALGKPAREILRAVARDRHDLVVIGTKGLNGARRLLLGSTTSEILRRAGVPVLAVPPADALEDRPTAVPASWPGRTIVAAIELGPRAARDVQRAADVARWFGTRLLLAHVVPGPAAPPWFSANLDAHMRIERSKAETALETLRAGLNDVRAAAAVRVGHPPDEIAAITAEQKAGLIVMALRGRAGLFGEPPGSWAYHVLCHGVAPVLALPDPRQVARRGA
jgi:nucleotide-binding universal stress UspA family protein